MSQKDAEFHSYHDMGGQPAGAIDRHEHHYDLWEKRVDALMVLLSGPDKQIIRVDELRRAIESLPPEDYDNLIYYERWISAITTLLLEKGVLSRQDIDGRIADMKARGVGVA